MEGYLYKILQYKNSVILKKCKELHRKGSGKMEELHFKITF